MQYDIIITGNCVHFWKFESNLTAVNKPADEVPRSQPLIVHLLIVFYGSICPDDYRTRLPLEYPSSACDFCLSHFPFTKKNEIRGEKKCRRMETTQFSHDELKS